MYRYLTIFGTSFRLFIFSCRYSREVLRVCNDIIKSQLSICHLFRRASLSLFLLRIPEYTIRWRKKFRRAKNKKQKKIEKKNEHFSPADEYNVKKQSAALHSFRQIVDQLEKKAKSNGKQSETPGNEFASRWLFFFFFQPANKLYRLYLLFI